MIQWFTPSTWGSVMRPKSPFTTPVNQAGRDHPADKEAGQCDKTADRQLQRTAQPVAAGSTIGQAGSEHGHAPPNATAARLPVREGPKSCSIIPAVRTNEVDAPKYCPANQTEKTPTSPR